MPYELVDGVLPHGEGFVAEYGAELLLVGHPVVEMPDDEIAVFLLAADLMRFRAIGAPAGACAGARGRRRQSE